MKTMLEVNTTSIANDLIPATLQTPCGPATELPINLFLHRALPPLKDGMDIKEIANRLVRTGGTSPCRRPIIREGRWRGFARDPVQMECSPDVAFHHFPDVVSAIIEASYIDVHAPVASISLRNNPRYTETVGDRKDGDLPDAYLLSSEPPVWANIIASGEYEKTDTEKDREENIFKVVSSMAECMFRDARRRFTFAFTVENTNMRLWYSSRCQIIASEPFNFITNREPMIHFFLALAYADPSQLGWDMSMTPLKDGRNFDIRIDSLDGTQCVYRTLKLLSCPGLGDLRGKGTRIWKAVLVDDNQPQGEPVVLKDAWVDADREVEGDILKHVRALPVNTETHASMHLEGAFPTTVCHGYVFVDADRTHVDSVRSLFPADDVDGEQDESLPPFGLRSPRSQHEQSVAPPGPRSRRWWAHYRIVFQEIGQPLLQAQTLPVIFKTLAQIAYALHHLHQGGWVHRDISPGNILIVGGRGTLIDMEYATKLGQGPEYQIGTPGFVPIEVGQQGYLLQWAVPSPKGSKKARSPPPSKEDILRRMLRREGEEPPKRERIIEFSPDPPFRYNALHDLESLWWVAVYFLIKRRVVDGTQGPPTREDLLALGPQCRLAYQLFEGNDGRIQTVTAARVFAGHGRKLHPSLHRVAIMLDQLRQDLFTAYVTQEAEPLSTDLVPDIHSAFMQTFLDIADAPLEHITLLPLPSIDFCGNVILPDVKATRGTKRTSKDREAELETSAVEEPPRKRAKRSRIAPRQVANVAERTRPYLPRKAKTHRAVDRSKVKQHVAAKK